MIENSQFGEFMSAIAFNEYSPRDIKSLLMKKGFLVVSKATFTKEEYRDLISTFGELVEYTGEKSHIGFGFKDILSLDGDKEKIIQGIGELPLHVDGGLLRARIDLVYLYAVEISNLKYQGATIICNQEKALLEMPIHLRRVLENEVFETIVLEKGYYLDGSPEDWFEVPTFIDYGWVKQMLVYFPVTKPSPPSWDTRIKGFTALETATFFKELKDFMLQPRYCYKHFWSTGDLLIIDNRKVMHAREPFYSDSVRKLYRGQTISNDSVNDENFYNFFDPN